MTCLPSATAKPLFPDLVGVLKKAREQRSDRAVLLEEFDRLEGVYVPSRYPLKKQGLFLVPDLGGKKVRKRVCPDLDRVKAEPAEIVPICDVVFNRLNVEIARGCPQNCRFCQAKSYYAPFRVRAAAPTLDFIGGALAATGYEMFSLASLSSGDYPELPELLRRIPAAIQPDISFSVPSLRPATLSEELLATLAMFRKTGITIVPEAGSERLRRSINKNVTDAEIFHALDIAWKHGWQKVKMYFMIGLPGETDEDVEAIALLAGEDPARGAGTAGAGRHPRVLLLVCPQGAHAAAVGGAGLHRRTGGKGRFPALPAAAAQEPRPGFPFAAAQHGRDDPGARRRPCR